MKMYAGWNSELEALIRKASIEAGFQLTGVASADGDDDEASALSRRRFESWVSAGRAGEMEYLKRRDADGTLLRSGLRVAIPWARSVVVCALDYSSTLPRSIDSAAPDAGWIGRYAWSGTNGVDSSGKSNVTSAGEGGEQGLGTSDRVSGAIAMDYHDQLLARLRLIEARLHESAECETRCYVDTGPIVERDFAARVGVGWIGKNTCVINQEMGSWLLLGVIVTSLPVIEPSAQVAAPDRCGSCTRCIDACPTDALVAPREMDASRCIAYLTIEKKGAVAEELREGIGRQVFGCDICQDVCPWNGRGADKSHGIGEYGGSVPGAPAGMVPRPELVNPSLEWLAAMDAKEFKRWFKGSPLERTGRKRLHRNVAIAMGNSGETSFAPRLREWAEGEDEVLAEAARWALGRLELAAPAIGAVC